MNGNFIKKKNSKVIKLEELNWKQVDELDRDKTIIFLPISPLEEHGPHLPVGTDFLTTKDAVILASSINPVVPSKTGKHAETWEIHQKYHEKNRQAGKPPGLVKLRMKYKDRYSDWWFLLLAEPDLMSDMADDAGWKLDEVLGPPEYYVGVLKKR